jgi:regulator of Ty1 transposition protein 103
MTDLQTELDKNRSSSKKPLLGGSFFGGSGSGSVPPELQPLVPLQVNVSKASVTTSSAVNAANAEFDKMNDPSTPDPTPPVHAARLSQLLKTLANAESSVSEIIKSRQSLIEGLEKLLDSNRASLTKENSLLAELSEKKAGTESRKRDVEDAIMRGLSAEDSPAIHNGGDAGSEAPRPEVEALTPPPVESLTPPGEAPETSQPHPFTFSDHQMDGQTDFHDDMDMSYNASYNNDDSANGLNSKRRKVGHDEEGDLQFSHSEFDADVDELIRQGQQ